jgi:hypothetical protein
MYATQYGQEGDEIGHLWTDTQGEVHADGLAVHELNDAIVTRLGLFTRKDGDRFLLATALFRGYGIKGMDHKQVIEAWKADQRPPEEAGEPGQYVRPGTPDLFAAESFVKAVSPDSRTPGQIQRGRGDPRPGGDWNGQTPRRRTRPPQGSIPSLILELLPKRGTPPPSESSPASGQ